MKQHRTNTHISAFSIETRVTKDVAEISLRGEADLSIQRQLHQQLAAVNRTAARELRLQLSELDFCDSTVAGELVAFAEEARTNGKHVTVTAATPWTWTILALVDSGESLNLTANAVDVPSSPGDGDSIMSSAPVLRIITGMLTVEGHIDNA